MIYTVFIFMFCGFVLGFIYERIYQNQERGKLFAVFVQKVQLAILTGADDGKMRGMKGEVNHRLHFKGTNLERAYEIGYNLGSENWETMRIWVDGGGFYKAVNMGFYAKNLKEVPAVPWLEQCYRAGFELKEGKK